MCLWRACISALLFPARPIDAPRARQHRCTHVRDRPAAGSSGTSAAMMHALQSGNATRQTEDVMAHIDNEARRWPWPGHVRGRPRWAYVRVESQTIAGGHTRCSTHPPHIPSRTLATPPIPISTPTTTLRQVIPRWHCSLPGIGPSLPSWVKLTTDARTLDRASPSMATPLSRLRFLREGPHVIDRC